MGTLWERSRVPLSYSRYAKAPESGAFNVLYGADGETRIISVSR